jgi:hypothetical protein
VPAPRRAELHARLTEQLNAPMALPMSPDVSTARQALVEALAASHPDAIPELPLIDRARAFVAAFSDGAPQPDWDSLEA